MSDFIYRTDGPLHKSWGTLNYRIGDNGGYSLRVECDTEISRYYRSLIPKWIKTNPQAYPAHISVVRKEIPPNLEYWGMYEGAPVEFLYTHTVYSGKVYWWLNVFSTLLEEIRKELGLPVHSEYTLPPEGFTKCFHLTIGNSKSL